VVMHGVPFIFIFLFFFIIPESQLHTYIVSAVSSLSCSDILVPKFIILD
jgi:hypothetical protein